MSNEFVDNNAIIQHVLASQSVGHVVGGEAHRKLYSTLQSHLVDLSVLYLVSNIMY